VLISDLIFPVYKIDHEHSKGLSKSVRTIGSSSHRGPVILERKKSGSDPGQFQYAMITDAVYKIDHEQSENMFLRNVWRYQRGIQKS
jgi:hypothetical protein